MKIKNLSNRNQGITVPNKAIKDNQGNTGFQKGDVITFPAGATLEIDDALYKSIQKDVVSLAIEGILQVQKISTLTKGKIVAKVKEETGEELDESLTKEELQKQAEALGVDV